MTTIYSSRLRNEFRSSVKRSCKAQDCNLHLDGFPSEKVILDVDSIKRLRGRKCDYAIIADEPKTGNVFLLPIEFKSTVFAIDKVAEQIKNVVIFIEKEIPTVPICYPVLVSKKINRKESKDLQRIQIESRSGRKRIKHVLCNQSLEWSDVKKASHNS